MPFTGWACTNLFENFSENSLKGDLSNDTTDNPPHFSLVNSFKRGPTSKTKNGTNPIHALYDSNLQAMVAENL